MKHKLDTLIRLRRQEINEKRRQLVELQEELDRLQELATRLRIALVSEQLPGADPEAGYTYNSFVQATMGKEEILAGQMQALDEDIVRITGDLHEAFQGLKRFEIVAERAAAVEKREADKRDQEAIDEMALDRFRASKLS